MTNYVEADSIPCATTSTLTKESLAVHNPAYELVHKNANLTIHQGKQQKHIAGAKNYLEGRSVLTHSDPQQLVNDHAGTGVPLNSTTPRMPGYKEVIDCNEIIGLCKNKEGLVLGETTRMTVHYSKEGVHIVPAPPSG